MSDLLNRPTPMTDICAGADPLCDGHWDHVDIVALAALARHLERQRDAAVELLERGLTLCSFAQCDLCDDSCTLLRVIAALPHPKGIAAAPPAEEEDEMTEDEKSALEGYPDDY